MKRSEKQEKLRNSILNTLLRLCSQESIYDLKTDEIAKQANISKRTLYQYFSSKDHMYLSLVEYAFKSLNVFIDYNLKHLDTQDTLDIIISIGENFLNFALDEPVLSKLITEYNETKYTDTYPDMINSIAMYAGKYEISPYLQKLFDERAVEDVDAKQIGLMLWSQLQGLAILVSSKKEFVYEYYNTNRKKVVFDCVAYLKEIIENKIRS